MPSETADEDFDAIFGGESDSATRSKLAISPPKLPKPSNKRPSETRRGETGEEGGKIILERLQEKSEDIDYEFDKDDYNDDKNYLSTPKKTRTGSCSELESVSITPAKASEMLQEILKNRPPKISADLAGLASKPAISSGLATEKSEKKFTESKGHFQKPAEPKKPKESATSKDVKNVDKNAEKRDSNGAATIKAPSEASVPSGYSKQNYEKLQAQAIERKRHADGLKEGKELPVYLKSMSLYAMAYSQYELFGTDCIEKWRGLLEFATQIEKKCAGYKNEITIGLCSSIMAWTHIKIISAQLQELQSIALPLAEKTSLDSKVASSLAIIVTQVSLHHEKVKSCWLRASNLVPSISKYGFSVYSSVEDLCKTIDRYI